MNPSFILEEKDNLSYIKYLFPEPDAPFFMSIFLKSALMDSARGDPFLSRSIAEKVVTRNGPLISPKQVHGITVLSGKTDYSLPERPEGDGIILEYPGIEGSLRFADCFPVIIASLDPKPWIAILHSGYKGVLSNISGVTCDLLFKHRKGAPERTFAWIGPGIGRKFYNRKKQDLWTQKGIDIFSPEFREEKGATVFFDLSGQIRSQLLQVGLLPENICLVPFCTFDRKDLFYSYRNGDTLNRLFLLAFLME